MKRLCVFFLLITSIYAADNSDVEFTSKTFLKKDWYGAFFYCADKQMRLPTEAEAYSLPQKDNDVFTVYLNYIQARSDSKRVICVHDRNNTRLKRLIFEDIEYIKNACGYTKQAEDLKVSEDTRKSLADKATDIASSVGEAILRVGGAVAGAALVVATGGSGSPVGGGLLEMSFSRKNDGLNLTDDICRDALKLEQELNKTN